MRAEVRSGLDRAEALGVGHGYAEVTGGLRGVGKDFAAYARGEAGWRPAANVVLFGYGEGLFGARITPEWQAGVGARVTW